MLQQRNAFVVAGEAFIYNLCVSSVSDEYGHFFLLDSYIVAALVSRSKTNFLTYLSLPVSRDQGDSRSGRI